ncbi:hypothetical protein AB1N83_008829 [Pleurotus pulmonarius]
MGNTTSQSSEQSAAFQSQCFQTRARISSREAREQEFLLRSPVHRRHSLQDENAAPPSTITFQPLHAARTSTPPPSDAHHSQYLQPTTVHNQVLTPPPSEVPNRRALAQRERRARERAEREHQSALRAQQARRQRERLQWEREEASTTSLLANELTMNRRSIAQQARRERERNQRQREATPQPLGLPPTPSSEPTISRRSIAQQARRERERIVREQGAVQQLTQPETLSAGETAPSRRSLAQQARRERERAQRLNMALDTLRQLPTPPATQQSAPGCSNLGRMVTSATDLFMAARRAYIDPPTRHDLGRMNIQCPHCSALHWNDERTYNSRRCLTPAFGTCCNHGKVQLPPPRPPPDTLRLLLDADDPQSREFRANIRMYNMALAFTSLGVKQDHSVNQRFGGNTWVFRIQGQLHHNSGSLESEEGTAPSYAQLYIHDPDVALRQRMNRNSTLSQDTMAALQTMLIQHHQC